MAFLARWKRMNGTDPVRDVPVRSVTGDLTALVHGFVSRIPGEGSGAFAPPTPEQRARMRAAFGAIVAGDLEEAAVQASPLRYAVVRYRDFAAERDLLVLAEMQRPDGSWPHAWGLYVHAPDADSDLTVEVPHPIDDLHTDLIGADVFRVARAVNLFVAGAQRRANRDGSADVAHNPESPFEAIHRAALAGATNCFSAPRVR